MQRVVVLGAGGFIGRALVARLAREGVPVTAVARHAEAIGVGISASAMGNLSPNTDLITILEGAESVVHLASRAHKPIDGASVAHWIETEAASARHVAASAVRARLRKVVLMSSAKVHGEATHGTPFRADQPLAPVDAYGHAKAHMERAMADTLRDTDTMLVIVRPPLVYGPGVKANFLALLRLVCRAPVLPLASIANRRSFLYLENLVDLLCGLLARPDRVGGAFLARDGEDLSTPDLLRRIGRHLGRVPALLPCPAWALRLAGQVLGHGEAIARLTESLELDDHVTRSTLQWEAPYGVEDGLAATCRWYLRQERDAP
jgi:nucleoside-diphosphate-sugar epimerase